ncbi:MAG: hypothetical protein HQK83_04715 [Fibrobacteria bacterium]|nr:hypothetical protein [Fibrobacteria bacterium]
MKKIVLLLSLLFFLCNCGMQYTRHISSDYEGKKIEAKTFGILPVTNIDHQPPQGGCMLSKPKPIPLEKIEQNWANKLTKNLTTRFPKHNFKAFSKDDLEENNVSIVSVYEKASRMASSAGLSQIPITKSNQVQHVQRRQSMEISTKLSKLDPNGDIDFFIILSNPKLKGETQTTTNYNAHGGMTTSTKTVYSSDVEVTVWEAQTGNLVYTTGALGSSSGFCFFVSPIDGAVNASGSKITTRLKDIIAKILKEHNDFASKM